jgi:signal transduction histidine kinase
MKPAHVWSAFGLCAAVLLAALVWISASMLRLERAELAARAQATLEENTRLALWRLDSALMPLLARESSRPSAEYAPEPSGLSPLFAETPPEVWLHFQLAPGAGVTSPQVPSPAARPAARGRPARDTLDQRSVRLNAIRTALASEDLTARLPREPAAPPPPMAPKAVATAARAAPSAIEKFKNVNEYMARQQAFQRANVHAPTIELPTLAPAPPIAPAAREGALTPLWIGEALVLARRVGVGGDVHVQGCWLDWPALRAEMLASIEDLLPGARLEPAAAAARPDEERRLATLPVRLVPGNLTPAPPTGLSPTRLSLAGVWACALLATLAVGVLLRGVMELSERRRIFVSAVTHELRTPLTTFRLYTDMLAEDMVPREERRREYVGRLRAEAERLGHLVENVLFYARVETGRGAAPEVFDLGLALEEMRPRLAERADRAGLELDLVLDGPAATVRADRAALEQVLLNLVDNACKYAAAATPPRIEMKLSAAGGRATVRVRDHGPGLSPAGRSRLFRPFSKSDREAANSAPGIGLGLALSRRLARAQGGELSLESTGSDGAVFALSLPLAESR